MSYYPTEDYGTSSVEADYNFGSTTMGDATPVESLGPNIFPAQPGQLPPEAYQSQTPTVRTLPPKVVKNTLPPQYKTNTLPPKVVTTRLQPIYPPGTGATSYSQY